MSASPPATAPRVVRLCLWCVVAVMVEVGLYLSYRGHDARFHWFTHFFVGSAAALVAMSVVALRTRRPVPASLVWLLVGHLFAMLPDLAFTSGHVRSRTLDGCLPRPHQLPLRARQERHLVLGLPGRHGVLPDLDRLRPRR